MKCSSSRDAGPRIYGSRPGIAGMTGMEIMTGIKDMKNNVRKERRASLQLRSRDVKSGMNKGGYKMKRGGEGKQDRK